MKKDLSHAFYSRVSNNGCEDNIREDAGMNLKKISHLRIAFCCVPLTISYPFFVARPLVPSFKRDPIFMLFFISTRQRQKEKCLFECVPFMVWWK